MRIDNYQFPKSSFLSIEKDLNLITTMMLKNERLKKLLYYTGANALDRPDLTDEQTYELFGKNILIVPTIPVDKSVQAYIIITFDKFTPNETNPEFRDHIIAFDIICHLSEWQMKDFDLRPYKIAAEIDYMMDKKRLSGIGKTEFIGASQAIVSDEFGGVSLLYRVVSGEEDKKNMINPINNAKFIEEFNRLFDQ